MGTVEHSSAVTYIHVLNDAINEIWARYAADARLDSLAYSEGGYGTMQKQELTDILNQLNAVKTSINALDENCKDII